MRSTVSIELSFGSTEQSDSQKQNNDGLHHKTIITIIIISLKKIKTSQNHNRMDWCVRVYFRTTKLVHQKWYRCVTLKIRNSIVLRIDVHTHLLQTDRERERANVEMPNEIKWNDKCVTSQKHISNVRPLFWTQTKYEKKKKTTHAFVAGNGKSNVSVVL